MDYSNEVILELFRGEIAPCDNNSYDEKALKEYNRYYESIVCHFTEEQLGYIETLIIKHNHLSVTIEEESFVNGFRLGGKMIADVFYGVDKDVWWRFYHWIL